MLLIHSINAAGSAYEVRPLYEHYRNSRTVYALDLPGYGFSERDDRDYTPRLMTDAIHSMVAEIQRLHGDAPIDVLALSLSGEFLARAAFEAPAAFRSLALDESDRFQPEHPRIRATREHAGAAGAAQRVLIPALEPRLLRPADQQAQYPIFSGEDLGIETRSMKDCSSTTI